MPSASKQASNQGVLLSHGLFGESTQLPDVMHCETIAIRSSLHDWELAPHRHDRLHQIMVVHQGSGVVQLEGEHTPFAANTLINVPAGSVHAFRFTPATEGYVITLADEMLDLILVEAADVRYALGHGAVCDAPPQALQISETIWHEFNGLERSRALVLRGLCSTLLGLTARQLFPSEQGSTAQDRTHVLQRFEALLDAHYLEHWGVAQYARSLSISPTHFNRLVRAATGSPASALINARLVREARRQLAYTNLRIASIADALGFSDQSHFSRVFSRATGVSPRTFRQQLAQRTPAY
ncbi:helix-turn-helix domain-containing protein [Curvibacter sp. CHRR-16]|uniref:helix-turn-helix domain-containing protein n=1 Tax=Curvibacter sp. CHRR-16 TaxID=2835872 RepID=UPI001BD93501|nr:helix-turn-helix domain-containing protein [Curvibacter sp. CHRR-16]MBT0568858.1 helix-turn-helix domain-containing protein [Curvibacter sp. CHRR-16]